MRKVDETLAFFGRLLLAPRCLVCAERGAGGLDLCAACRASLPWNCNACHRCGLPLAQAASHCGRCLKSPPPFTCTQAALRYEFPLDRLLPRFKFHGDLAAGALLGTLLAQALETAPRPDLLLPVPLHPARLRERGYDQALELAKVLAASGGPPVCRDRLLRVRATAAQTRLGALSRRRNVRGAFALRAGVSLPAHVALIDDVMTTGATVRECARILLAAGVRRVDVWVVARAPPRVSVAT